MDQASAFSFDMSYCGTPPTLEVLWSRWNLDPALIAVLVATGLVGSVMLRRATPERRLGFGAAWLIATILFVSPLCALTVALFSARVGHHIVLRDVTANVIVDIARDIVPTIPS